MESALALTLLDTAYPSTTPKQTTMPTPRSAYMNLRKRVIEIISIPVSATRILCSEVEHGGYVQARFVARAKCTCFVKKIFATFCKKKCYIILL